MQNVDNISFRIRENKKEYMYIYTFEEMNGKKDNKQERK